MRTNIVLNDELLRKAARYGKGRSKRALVEEALETFVAVKSAERRRATYRERLSSLEYGATVYDAVYIALSRSLDLPLLTAERTTAPWVVKLGRRVESVREG